MTKHTIFKVFITERIYCHEVKISNKTIIDIEIISDIKIITPNVQNDIEFK